MGADNVRRMQRLGVKYPDGLDSGIDRLEAERDAHRSMLCDLLASAASDTTDGTSDDGAPVAPCAPPAEVWLDAS
jgi:hypothetical protein